MSLLEVRELSVEFGSRRVVDRVSFSLDAGEKLALVGESGSGKTVTALSLLRLIETARLSGEVLFSGKDVLKMPDPALRELRGRDVAGPAQLDRSHDRGDAALDRLVEGDALETLPGVEDGFDVVFLDADRPSYLAYLELVVPKLRPGGLLIADNATSHASELQEYLGRVKSHPQLFAVTVPIGNGEEIALKLGE